MARSNPRYYDLSQNAAPIVDLQGNRVRTFGPGRRNLGSASLGVPGEYQISQTGGQRVLRQVKTKAGRRDLVVDQQGRVQAVLNPGSGAKIRRGANGKVVVGLSAPGGGAAPGASGGSTPDTNAPTGPVDPYADYPSIKAYLASMDTGYTKLQDYFKNTLIPNVTAGTTALAGLSKGVSGAYQGMINNYAGSAGNVASSITTPQVAGSGSGPIYAPNQNALGAAQSLAATTKVGRDLAAGYQSTVDQLGAERISAGTLAYVSTYSSGLLTQYATKKNEEMLKLNMWIEEQKTAATKLLYEAEQDKLNRDVQLRGQDITTQNALIMSGDRKAAIAATTRGQDISSANAAADRQARIDAAAAKAARAGRFTDDQLSAKDFRMVPKGAGPKNQAIIDQTKVKSLDGNWWYKPKSSGSASGGAGGTTIIGAPQLRKQFTEGWSGSPGKPDPLTGTIDESTKTAPLWNDPATKIKQAVDWIMSRRANFPKMKKKGQTGQLRTWLGTVSGLSGADIESIIESTNNRL